MITDAIAGRTSHRENPLVVNPSHVGDEQQPLQDDGRSETLRDLRERRL